MQEINLTAEQLVKNLLSLGKSAQLCLFDSCGRTLGGSRYLIAGIKPAESVEFHCRTQAEAFEVLRFLDERLNFYQAKSNVSQPFGGGFCAATLAYDFGLLLEDLTPREKEFGGVDEPLATFTFYENYLIHDYTTGKTRVSESSELAGGFSRTFDPPAYAGGSDPLVKSNFTKTEYLAAVEKIRKHIALGNIYQANLTQQLRAELPEDLTPEQIFWRLRSEHPAPFAAFIRRNNDTVVSASPERFIRVRSPKSKVQSPIVTASPIKGTRRRGKTVEEDLRLRLELEQSAKDRAENVMIVDLLRNDIGRVCEFDTVKVEKLCEIEEHPTLFHLVSTIRGQLRKDAKMSDLLKATFPCGSITGAPKIRAMEILDEIETAPRGLSMGATGYFAFDGSADLNVAIRTITVRNQTAVFNVGGGIVFDSQPEAEYEESLIKAQALLNALGFTKEN